MLIFLSEATPRRAAGSAAPWLTRQAGGAHVLGGSCSRRVRLCAAALPRSGSPVPAAGWSFWRSALPCRSCSRVPRELRSLLAISAVSASMVGLLACPQLLTDDFATLEATDGGA